MIFEHGNERNGDFRPDAMLRTGKALIAPIESPVGTSDGSGAMGIKAAARLGASPRRVGIVERAG